MADLSGITDLNFIGLMRGAYKDPVFGLEGVDELATLVEILEWLGNNVGGGGGGSAGPYDVYDDDAAAASEGCPSAVFMSDRQQAVLADYWLKD